MTEISRLEACIDALLAENGVDDAGPGYAVGVYRGQELLYADGHGLADLSAGTRLDATSLFNIASTSKQFTAFAILLLVEDGVVARDDRVRKYVPELPAYADCVSVRHLLHHTAGLRDYVALWRLNGRAFADRVETSETIALLAAQRAANAPAGTDYSYNNTGYFLLSLVAERASGCSLAAFSRARIFEPLGMASTTIVERYPSLLPDLALGYSRGEAGSFEVDVSAWEPVGDGQVHTNVLDMQRWHDNFRTAAIGNKSALEWMRTPGTLDNGRLLPYGGGIEFGRLGTHATERHSGGWAGYRSEFLRLPDCDLGIAVFANRTDTDPSAIADALALAALGEAALPCPVDRARSGLSAGFYRNARFTDHVTIESADEGLVLDDGDEAQPLYRDGNLIVAVDDGRLVLSQEGDALTIDSGDGWETYLLCERWSPDARELATLAGHYRNDETGLAYEIVLDGETLVATGPLGPLVLMPQSPFAFSTDGRPVLRFEAGGMMLDIGQRVRHVRFERRA